jgi:succinate dehydrogenase/fumarate reductase flavoprotein subunit
VSSQGWDEVADLAVVGFGAAGSCVAITAADLGASVAMLEKQPAERHTPNTRASSGFVAAVDDVAKALAYFDHCAGGMIPLAVTRAWVERADDVIEWLESAVGIEMTTVTGAEHMAWPGSEAVSAWGPAEAYPEGARTFERLINAAAGLEPPAGGRVLFAALEAAVTARGRIAVRYEHAAQRLVRNTEGRVVGVEAMTPQGMRRIRGRNGVVLTCGGYDHDEAMKLEYLPLSPTYFYGSPMNTGDGVRMAQAVGADLWHMNSMLGRAIAHFELNGETYNFPVSMTPGGYVLTDKHGKRFANEHMQASFRHDFYRELAYYDAEQAEYPRIPCYWFFDERRMVRPPVFASASAAVGPHPYQWSDDSRDEAARGWIHTADDIETLAGLVGLADPGQAAQTIADYNQACTTGKDAFGRPADSLVELDRPPFHCMKLWPGGPNTTGGPRRNERSQVIDVYGRPIEGLYAAGELGEAVGAVFPSNGCNISDGLCFGRIAAAHALGQTSTAQRGELAA